MTAHHNDHAQLGISVRCGRHLRKGLGGTSQEKQRDQRQGPRVHGWILKLCTKSPAASAHTIQAAPVVESIPTVCAPRATAA